MIFGSSTAEMMRTLPWHLAQMETSILNTRFSSLAHDIRLASAFGFGEWVSSVVSGGCITKSSGQNSFFGTRGSADNGASFF